MKHNKYPQDQTQKPANTPHPTTAANMTAAEFNFTPAPEEVARRAYFAYVNQGSPNGHEVQHWLQAESDLINEHRLIRAHAFHHET